MIFKIPLYLMINSILLISYSSFTFNHKTKVIGSFLALIIINIIITSLFHKPFFRVSTILQPTYGVIDRLFIFSLILNSVFNIRVKKVMPPNSA